MQTQLTIRIRAILLLSFHVLHAIWAATSSGAQHNLLAHGRQPRHVVAFLDGVCSDAFASANINNSEYPTDDKSETSNQKYQRLHIYR